MKIKFSIHYNTAWGEEVHVVVRQRYNDGKTRDQNLRMNTQDGSLWTLETTIHDSRQRRTIEFTYRYQIEAADGYVFRREWNRTPRRYVYDESRNYIFPDVWRDRAYFCKDAGIDALSHFKSDNDDIAIPAYNRTAVFRVAAPQLRDGESVALLGSHPALGNWNPTRYLSMSPIGRHEWAIAVNIDNVDMPIEWKYVVVDNSSHELKEWEEGDNRTTYDLKTENRDIIVLYGAPLRVSNRPWRAAGIVTPLFSLRSEQSYGVGDLADLRRLIDWAAQTGLSIIQLLPVNDTTSTHTWTDSHPYNSICCHALHPHYISLDDLGQLQEGEMAVFNRQRRELNALEYSDYIAVDKVKNDYINKVFQANGQETLLSEDYKNFYKDNEQWLVPYAAFCILRDHFSTSRTSDWKQYALFSMEQCRKICSPEGIGNGKADIIFFTQYHLHKQMKAASQYAHDKGVALKADLPIGVYRDSVETWQHPEFFHIDMQMGTPPDSASSTGQNWGFPTYNWDAPGLMTWMKERLHYIEQYFDAVRIDHVVGLFRSWEIPSDFLFASMGHFAPSLPLSLSDIGAAGLTFRHDLFLKPFINDDLLRRLFGLHQQYVKDTFLNREAYNLYSLRHEFDTQKKIQTFFSGKNDENSQWIRDGLYRLCSNVLFLEDPWQKDKYHPRLGAINDSVYNLLNQEEKDAYLKIYNNYFYDRHNIFWEQIGRRRLEEMIADTDLLVCAEDLGMIPGCVPAVLSGLGILSLEVQTMPKAQGYEFTHLEANPYLSVCTISTHDMPTMRMWWEENTDRTQRYYMSMLQKEGKAPRTLSATLSGEIVARHLNSPSMLCMIAVQDWLAMSDECRAKDAHSERINSPYDSYNRWQYRMPVTIETLISNTTLNRKIKNMIRSSKR